MSEVAPIDAEDRWRRAEARLAASRPFREAAAAAHARTSAQGENSLVRKSLTEIAAEPYRMNEAERSRMLAMMEVEVEAAALADLDNPPWTDEELEQAARERDARRAEERAKRSARTVEEPRGTETKHSA